MKIYKFLIFNYGSLKGIAYNASRWHVVLDGSFPTSTNINKSIRVTL